MFAPNSPLLALRFCNSVVQTLSFLHDGTDALDRRQIRARAHRRLPSHRRTVDAWHSMRKLSHYFAARDVKELQCRARFLAPLSARRIIAWSSLAPTLRYVSAVLTELSRDAFDESRRPASRT